jgi:hypothetical protein
MIKLIKTGIVACSFGCLHAADLFEETPVEETSLGQISQLDSSTIYLQNDAFSTVERIFSESGVQVNLHGYPTPDPAMAFTCMAFHATLVHAEPHLLELIKNKIIGKNADWNEAVLRIMCDGQICGAVASALYDMVGIGIWRNEDVVKAAILRKDFEQSLMHTYGTERGQRFYQAIYGLGAIADGEAWILRERDDIERFMGYLSYLDRPCTLSNGCTVS